MNILFDYPSWTLVFLILSFVVAALLYFKTNKLKETFKNKPYYRWLLFSLRSLYILLILFLIFNPQINKKQKHIQKPKIIFAQDNSSSMLYNIDSQQINKIKAIGSNIKKDLDDEFDFEYLSFGSMVIKDSLYELNEQETNIGKLFKYIHYQYNNENISAIVLSTDGIYNRGENPLYTTPPPAYPVFSIALGDTNNKNDLIIIKAEHNDLSFLNNSFFVHPLILSKGLQGKYNLNVYSIKNQKENLIKSQSFNINKGQEKRLSIKLKAKSIGLKHYRLRIDLDQNDKNHINNEYDFFIDVIDDRQKILLTYDAPHPDIGCIKQIFNDKKNIQLDILNYKKIKSKKSINNYDLVILYQLPSRKNEIKKNKNLFKNIPKLYIIGNNSNLFNLNKLQNTIGCNSSSQSSNEVNSSIESDFSLFQISDDLKDFVANAPPLISPFSDYKKLQGHVLMYQKINSVKTGYPLLIINSGINKEALLMGEGIWRWRVNEYLYHNRFNNTDELFDKLINYLSQKDDKRKFRVKPNKKIFEENEVVSFSGQLYDDSYELINNAKIVLDIKGKDSSTKSYELQTVENRYHLDIGFLPTGDYQYISKCKWQENNYEANGSFSVKKGQLEYIETNANHDLLYKLAKNTNGNVYYLNELDSLSQSIKKLPKSNMSYFSSNIFDLIDEKVIFFIILFLMCLEWAIRKWLGYI